MEGETGFRAFLFCVLFSPLLLLLPGHRGRACGAGAYLLNFVAPRRVLNAGRRGRRGSGGGGVQPRILQEM